MDKERKLKIERAILALKDSVRQCEYYEVMELFKEAWLEHIKLRKIQNDLYDAIGGMDEYKYYIGETK